MNTHSDSPIHDRLWEETYGPGDEREPWPWYDRLLFFLTVAGMVTLITVVMAGHR